MRDSCNCYVVHYGYDTISSVCVHGETDAYWQDKPAIYVIVSSFYYVYDVFT